MVDNNNCPLCEASDSVKNLDDYGEQLCVDCLGCGKYKITCTIVKKLEPREKIILSHWMAKRKSNKEIPLINSANADSILKNNNLPKPDEQANNLIRYIGDQISFPDEKIKISSVRIASTIGAKGIDGVHYIADYLSNNQILNCEKDLKNKMFSFSLTFKGWNKYEELRKNIITGNYAFMAMQYGMKNHDEIYKDWFKPAVKETGFDLQRLDETLKAGLIDNQLRIKIRSCHFLLADLTNDNNGAYWEAGYAEGLGKEVIYLCEKAHFDSFKTHFDTNHHTTIIWERDKLAEAMEQLKATIRATLPNVAK